MNRKNTKKLLSVILSLVMVLSYLPASSFAFAVDGEAGPVVEADSNAGNDTTVNTDTGADNDTTTTGDSDQVTEGDKEDPPAVDDKKDEQAEPKEEGKKVAANTEAKEPAKGSEDEGEESEEELAAEEAEAKEKKQKTIYHVSKRDNNGREWKVFKQGSKKVISVSSLFSLTLFSLIAFLILSVC